MKDLLSILHVVTMHQRMCCNKLYMSQANVHSISVPVTFYCQRHAHPSSTFASSVRKRPFPGKVKNLE